jgi:glucosamine--fructose-6-phosphate aminotransferase (isomerizing)
MIKANYQHAMIKEILEEPEAVRATLNQASEEVRSVATSLSKKGFQIIFLSGSGTSYHASMIGQYVLSSLANVMTSSLPASEFASWIPASVASTALLIAISQSGESADMLAASAVTREKGMNMIALTNTPGSTLTRLADFVLLTRAGSEKAVTATKSYVTALVALYMLGLELGKHRAESSEQVEISRTQLEKTPDLLATTIRKTRIQV